MMTLPIEKPVTSSQRHTLYLGKKNLTKKPLLKKHIKGLKNSNGRNNQGRITVRHKGGGHKTRYRTIDFCRLSSATGIVCSIEYDPNRTANIAAIFDIFHSKFNYIIAPKTLKVGDIVKSGPNAETRTGHSLPISKIPVGSYIYNISSRPQNPSQISRSAGNFSRITEKTLSYAKTELSSGKLLLVSVNCYATIGIVSNEFTFLTKLRKAGQSRWINRRPTVRGVAMNPVDHPHGGGEGKKAGKGLTPWGKPTRGPKTSRVKNNPLLNIK